ncbi:lanC-like protein 2 isoform X2 [Microtus oregoni]|uniref:lanC-like protein 2 isoform X2 n=1 Tax=Microtus oregoni TaxID=111838 RepID=UPI001BB1B252|nr:lanC-like protein 2 isoform X2 [Microtus oregoni]
MGETMSKRLKLHLGEAEMEERAFPNPFPDYEAAASAAGLAAGAAEETGRACPLPTTDDPGLPFHPNGKIVSNFIKRIQTKIKDLLQQMEEGLKTADPHDCSAYTGWTGIALLYLQLYRVTGDQTYLLQSLDYVKRTLRNLSGRRLTFLCGDAGPLAVGAVIYHRLKSECESQECITKLLQMHRTVVCQESELPDELLYGRAGYLYALLYLNTEIGPGTVGETAIKEVVTAIIESGKTLSREERKTERCPLLYQWHRKQYIGAAHGMAGIYYMLMQVFKEEKYLKEAMECSDVIWQRGLLRKGYGICHGTSGNGYSFLSLYHLTQDKKYLYRACKFAEWCLDYGAHGCRIPDRPYSLFEGMAGAVHFLSDILVPETSRFPAFELGFLQKD